MDKKTINKLKIKWAGDKGWEQFRDLLVMKLIECKCEEDMTSLIKAMLGSMFGSVKELNKARKKANIQVLNEIEEKQLKDGNH